MPILEAGYELINEFLSRDELMAIDREVELAKLPAKAGGIRNADKKFSSVRDLANSEKLYAHAKAYLSGQPALVRAILFDKTADNNWLVSWHQDRTVAVSKKLTMQNWGPWSVKDGVHHVQPPVDVLDQMVAFRIHLDATNQENGCLRVMPGSHKFGILEQAVIQQYVQSHKPMVCEAPAASALVMRPHVLHSSRKASKPSQRRVLHLEYSSFELPSGLAWA